jgi:hypothetical protein
MTMPDDTVFKDMTVWMGIRKVIDSINANAAA